MAKSTLDYPKVVDVDQNVWYCIDSIKDSLPLKILPSHWISTYETLSGISDDPVFHASTFVKEIGLIYMDTSELYKGPSLFLQTTHNDERDSKQFDANVAGEMCNQLETAIVNLDRKLQRLATEIDLLIIEDRKLQLKTTEIDLRINERQQRRQKQHHLTADDGATASGGEGDRVPDYKKTTLPSSTCRGRTLEKRDSIRDKKTKSTLSLNYNKTRKSCSIS